MNFHRACASATRVRRKDNVDAVVMEHAGIRGFADKQTKESTQFKLHPLMYNFAQRIAPTSSNRAAKAPTNRTTPDYMNPLFRRFRYKKNNLFYKCKYISITKKLHMQAERVQIRAKHLLSKGCTASWFLPLDQEAGVADILTMFASHMLNGTTVDEYPIIKACFTTLLKSHEECMFVFMRRGVGTAAGILRSDKPLCSDRERVLLTQLGKGEQWNVPLWTWTEENSEFVTSMERQCVTRNLNGPCMGVWCYR